MTAMEVCRLSQKGVRETGNEFEFCGILNRFCNGSGLGKNNISVILGLMLGYYHPMPTWHAKIRTVRCKLGMPTQA